MFRVGRCDKPGCGGVEICVVLMCGESAVYQCVLEVLVFGVGDKWFVGEEL